MTLTCGCGGRYKRTDIKPVWSEPYKKFLYTDSDPLVAHWSCDKCGAPRTQKKRQAKPTKMITIQIESTFDSGDGPEQIIENFTATTWSEMIKILIDHHASAPVVPDRIIIKYP